MKVQRLIHWVILLALFASLLSPVPSTVHAQTTPEAKAQALMASMSPEERVGQLFLVTFTGTDASTESQVYDLVANHHVGGVVLLAGNDNFLPAPSTVVGAQQLINALQSIEWDASKSSQAQPANV